MLYNVDAYIEPQGSYELRKILVANGFSIYRFNPATYRSERYREDYSSDTELVQPDPYRKDLFHAIFSGHRSFPSQEVLKELEDNPKVVSYTINRTAKL